MKRCKWVNLYNKLYIDYHDNEWGRKVHDDYRLFEFLILEMFQAGLSWECVLNKREHFNKAFDNFDFNKVARYDEEKIHELMVDKNIIRNEKKIKSAINNAKVFIKIKKDYGSFDNYIWRFTKCETIKEIGFCKSELSEKISKDLKNKGMKFLGSTIIYSYLQAIGIINSHEDDCYLSDIL